MKTLQILYLLLLPFFLTAQAWNIYPYHEEGSVLYFPDDEGHHPGEPIEWWYTNGRLTGLNTGTHYSFMLTYFYFPALSWEGFRILNLCNEDTGEFFDETLPATYPSLAQDHLDITANVGFTGGTTETWNTKTDTLGNLIPWQYHISASGAYGALELDYQALKPPLMVGGDGLVDQGASNYSYYYSQTALEISGTLTYMGATEPVSGIAWIDRQYGDFNPNTGEPYEWFSLQLSNGMDINLWNIFTFDNEIPETSNYRIFTAFLNDTTTVWDSDFDLERLAYAWMPDQAVCYSQKWRFTSDALDLDVIMTANHADHEVQLPFRFYEGTMEIEGTVGGQPVTGQGFAELLHPYEDPEIQFLAPIIGEIWAPTQPIQWQLLNPDDGRPVYYDVAVSNDGKASWTHIVEGITGTEYTWDFSSWPADSLYWFRITGHSVDGTLSSLVESDAAWPILSGTRDQSDDISLRLFPNPAKEEVFVEVAGSGAELHAQLRNSDGKVLRSGSGTSPLRIDLANLPAGSYWLAVKTREGRALQKLIVH